MVRVDPIRGAAHQQRGLGARLASEQRLDRGGVERANLLAVDRHHHVAQLKAGALRRAATVDVADVGRFHGGQLHTDTANRLALVHVVEGAQRRRIKEGMAVVQAVGHPAKSGEAQRVPGVGRAGAQQAQIGGRKRIPHLVPVRSQGRQRALSHAVLPRFHAHGLPGRQKQRPRVRPGDMEVDDAVPAAADQLDRALAQVFGLRRGRRRRRRRQRRRYCSRRHCWRRLYGRCLRAAASGNQEGHDHKPEAQASKRDDAHSRCPARGEFSLETHPIQGQSRARPAAFAFAADRRTGVGADPHQSGNLEGPTPAFGTGSFLVSAVKPPRPAPPRNRGSSGRCAPPSAASCPSLSAPPRTWAESRRSP